MTKQEITGWYYSYIDEGPFDGPHETRDDAIDAARSSGEFEPGQQFFIGRGYKYYPPIDVEHLIDFAAEQDELLNDFWAGWPNQTPEQTELLQARVTKVWLEWLEEITGLDHVVIVMPETEMVK